MNCSVFSDPAKRNRLLQSLIASAQPAERWDVSLAEGGAAASSSVWAPSGAPKPPGAAASKPRAKKSDVKKHCMYIIPLALNGLHQNFISINIICILCRCR